MFKSATSSFFLFSFHFIILGASNFCVACGHGGHTYHLMSWFESMDVCPSGCGCRCLEVGTFIVDWMCFNTSRNPTVMRGNTLRATRAGKGEKKRGETPGNVVSAGIYCQGSRLKVVERLVLLPTWRSFKANRQRICEAGDVNITHHVAFRATE